MLANADDIVILAHSSADVKKKLLALENYCKKNKLEINCNKTKIICFHKGRASAEPSYICANEPIEVTNSYVYLGTLFSSSGLFAKNATSMASKGKIASGNIKSKGSI